MEYKIRKALPYDLNAIVLLQRQSLIDTLGVLVRTYEEDTEYYNNEILNTDVYVATTEIGTIIGYIGFGDQFDNNHAWVKHLRIYKEYQGFGVGKKLMMLAMEKYGILDLWCFQHIDARKFYQSLGFKEIEYTDGDNDENMPDVRMRWIR